MHLVSLLRRFLNLSLFHFQVLQWDVAAHTMMIFNAMEDATLMISGGISLPRGKLMKKEPQEKLARGGLMWSAMGEGMNDMILPREMMIFTKENLMMTKGKVISLKIQASGPSLAKGRRLQFLKSPLLPYL
jgi:hypothetical protein